MSVQAIRPAPAGSRLLRAALTHPATMAFKRRLKDAWWMARGAALRNPDIPKDVRSLLFVCQGNICRSPFAAMRGADLLRRRRGAHVQCTSAGIRTSPSARPPREACEAARAFGVALDDHQPVQLTSALLAAHDLTIVMEARQLLDLRRQYPAFSNRIVLLSLLDGTAAPGAERYQIADPYGHPFQTFERCYRRIDGALAALVAVLDEQAAAPRSPRAVSQRGARR